MGALAGHVADLAAMETASLVLEALMLCVSQVSVLAGHLNLDGVGGATRGRCGSAGCSRQEPGWQGG